MAEETTPLAPVTETTASTEQTQETTPVVEIAASTPDLSKAEIKKLNKLMLKVDGEEFEE